MAQHARWGINCNDQYHNHVRGIVWTAIERRRDARIDKEYHKKPDLSFALPFLSLVHTKITSTKLNIKLFSSSGGIKEKRTSTTTTTITTTEQDKKKSRKFLLI